MYSARRKKTERIKEFWHRHHAKHRARHNHGHRDTNYPAEYEPNSSPAFRSQSASPPSRRDSYHHDRDLIFFEPDPVYFNSPPLHSSSNFSSDYERYMRVRNMNMERIRELNQTNKIANTTGYDYTPTTYDYSTTSYPSTSYPPTSYPTSYSTSNPTPNSAPNSSSATPRHSGISSIEQELLNMVSFASPLPSYNTYNTSGRSTPPVGISSTYNYNAPYQQSSSLAPRPATSQGLSPLTELERFRTSFTSLPPSLNKPQYPPTTTTTSTATTSSSWSPQYSYPRYEIPDDYKSYEQKHDKPAITDIGLATERTPNLLRSSDPGSLLHKSPARPNFDPYNSYESDYSPAYNDTSTESNAKPSLHSSYSDVKQLSPIAEDSYSMAEPTPSYYNYTTPPPPPPSDSAPSVPPKITVSEPIPTPSPHKPTGVDGNISLQEDLENLLQNLEEHYKRRPSGIPKAPPPSPADAMSPTSYLGEAIFPDFDFTRQDHLSTKQNVSISSPRANSNSRRAALAPRSLAFDRSASPAPQSSLPSSLSSSETSSPSNSLPSSPTQFHLSPIQSDSDYYTPPPSPPANTTTSSTLSAPQPSQPPVLFSPAPPPPPPLSPLPPPPNNQELDCQGNLPSFPPAPLPFHDIDLQSLPPPIIPPPDFDYSAYDFQGNRLDRPPENDEIADIPPNEEIAEIAPLNQIAQIEPRNQIARIEPRNQIARIEDVEPFALTAQGVPQDALHTTSFSTETRTDPFGKTVTSTVTSNTSSPSGILSTVSTATTTKSSTGIPTSPTAERDQPTVIETLSTVTTALEAETGKVANARVTQTRVTHPGTEGEDITEISKEYEEGFLPSRPPSDAFSMSRLLEEIRNGKSLRKTPAPNYPAITATALPPSDEDPSVRTRTALVNVLASRRAQIGDDDSENENEDEEEKEWLWV